MTPVLLATAVAEYLAAAITDSPIPTALVSREFMPVYALAKLNTCRVPVGPLQTTSATASRGSANRERVIQIAPHLKSTPTGDTFDDVQIEQFVEFVRWIDETLESHGRIAGHTRESSQCQLYDVDTLHNQQILRGVISVTYRLIVRI